MQHRCKDADISKSVTHFGMKCIYFISTFSLCAAQVKGCCVDSSGCSTSLQDLLDLDVVCTEATVELEVVSIVEERTPKRKQQLL